MSDRLRGDRLERVKNEVVAFVEAAVAWVVVVPLLIVDRNSHFRRVAVVQAVAAFVVILAPEVLGVVNVGVVIHPVPIGVGGGRTPRLAIGTWLLVSHLPCCVGKRAGSHGNGSSVALCGSFGCVAGQADDEDARHGGQKSCALIHSDIPPRV